MKVIVAPLNWGLGHASRCVPIIQKLQQLKFVPIIASDGNSLFFLKKEFPELEYIELPSYNIKYGKNLKISLLVQFFKILKAVIKENVVINTYISKNKDVVGIISDNRFGVYSNQISSVYITHQIKVLSGFLSFITSFFHKRIIKKFNQCWIPDSLHNSLSGKLSKTKNKKLNAIYIGVLSRLKQEKLNIKWDVTLLLSGPEPKRTELETKLLNQFKNTTKKVLLIQGKVEHQQIWQQKGSVQVVNFMLTKELENTLNSSKLIISRSGYSTIMDLSVLEKKAVLIPTQGQNEQEYLAKFLQTNYGVKFVKENSFTLSDFTNSNTKFLPKEQVYLKDQLFGLFQGK